MGPNATDSPSLSWCFDDLGRTESISEALSRVLGYLRGWHKDNRWVGLEVTVTEEVALLRWAVERTREGQRLTFRSREGLEVVVQGFAKIWTGWGMEKERRAVEEVQRWVVEAEAVGMVDARVYAAMRFDREKWNGVGQDWESFGSFWMVFPRLELSREGEGATRPGIRLRVHFCANVEDSATTEAAILRLLQESGKSFEFSMKGCAHQGLLDSFDKYAEAMRQIAEDLAESRYQKIVLVRRRQFYFKDIPDPARIALELYRRIQSGYMFCLQISEETAFVGCSPESLFALEGHEFFTEALAGTIRRSKFSNSDLEAWNLLHSKKDLTEHHFVADHILDVLRAVDADISVQGPVPVCLPHLIHLRTTIRGEFHSNGRAMAIARAHDLLCRLHPTPAVCGLPPPTTMKRIPVLEGFDRGYYAGPFGYFGTRQSDFCVAIRSGLVRAHRIVAYAGGGIVPASKTRSEWDEAELKMSSFVDVLGGGNPHDSRELNDF